MRINHNTGYDWFSVARQTTVEDVAARLGVDGSARRGFPCPACGADRRGRDDNRGAVGVSRGGLRWQCYRCQVYGDALEYVSRKLWGRSFRDDGPNLAPRLADWFANSLAFAPMASRARPTREQVCIRPPANEVAELWAACRPAGSFCSGKSSQLDQQFLLERGVFHLRHVMQEHDLVRFAPLPGSSPSFIWWPSSRFRCWRLMTRAFEADGALASLHARSVVVFAGGAPKTLWPGASDVDDHQRYSASKLLFACQLGRRILGGEPVAQLKAVLVCEGITDWFAAAALFGADREWHRANGDDVPDVAVFGACSGGFQALAAVKWPTEQFEVWIATDQDAAGDRYAGAIVSAFPGRNVRRIDLVALRARSEARSL